MEPTPRIQIIASIPEDSPPASIQLVRGMRLIHTFDEPEPLPPTPAEPLGEIGQ